MALKRFISVLFLSALIFVASTQTALANRTPFLHKMASPTGMAIVGVTYAMFTGVSNFLWAFEWTRAGASPERSKKIQEAGGISAAAEAFLLGAIIPFWAYRYAKKHPVDPTPPL